MGSNVTCDLNVITLTVHGLYKRMLKMVFFDDLHGVHQTGTAVGLPPLAAVKEACSCKFSLNSKNEDHFYDGFTWVAMSHVT